MKDSWINHNTDKLLLFILVIIGGLLIMHMVHHSVDGDTLKWIETEVSTVVGALILILTGRIARTDGQTANGQPPTPTLPDPTPNPIPNSIPSPVVHKPVVLE
jgi:hypothetical protein